MNSIPIAKEFRISIDQKQLDDLRDRLSRSRLPPLASNPGWADGTSPDYLRSLISYWASDYDWRKAEAEINGYPNYQVTIDGTEIHYIHVPSRNPQARALVLTHGWPDSFYRYIRILPLLTDRYHIIIPSLPGYGFSGKVAKTSQQTASLWRKLVTEILGYAEFYASGGDLGAMVTVDLARHHQDRVKAVHLTDMGWEGLQTDPSALSEVERAFLAAANAWFMTEGAYIMMHSTKPLTAAYGLNDSPAALAAWAASFANGGQAETVVEGAFGGRDAFLTNLSIYWFTQTAASALSLYKRNAEATWGGQAELSEAKPTARPLSAPVALAMYPRDIIVPREWAERRGLNVRRYKVLPRGGHFAALEVPELFASELNEALTEIG